MPRILVVNPGSTSTKAGVFDDTDMLFSEEVMHPKSEIAAFACAADQLDYRYEAVWTALRKHPEGIRTFDAVAGRGGILQSLPGGTYRICADMIRVLKEAKYGEHPCNLGAPLAARFATEFGVPAFVVDPPVTDEMRPVARITGLPGITRRSVFHALNQRAAAREAARRLGLEYEKGAFITAHMGGGISIGAHLNGRVVDVINALDGEGPMSPERTGRLPVIPVLKMLEEGLPIEDFRKTVLSGGGMFAHLGTNDFREAVDRAESGDAEAEAVCEAMAYSISREIFSLVPSLMLDGPREIDAVVLTGGLARSGWLCAQITRLSGGLAPVEVVPGEKELAALAAGAVRGLAGDAVDYPVE